jgi:hypothetical protein
MEKIMKKSMKMIVPVVVGVLFLAILFLGEDGVSEKDLNGWSTGCWGDVDIIKRGDLFEHEEGAAEAMQALNELSKALGEKDEEVPEGICQKQAVLYKCKYMPEDEKYSEEIEQDFYRCQNKFEEWGVWNKRMKYIKEFPKEPISVADLHGWATGCFNNDLKINKIGEIKSSEKNTVHKALIDFTCKYQSVNEKSMKHTNVLFYRVKNKEGRWGLWNQQGKFIEAWPEKMNPPANTDITGWASGCFGEATIKNIGKMNILKENTAVEVAVNYECNKKAEEQYFYRIKNKDGKWGFWNSVPEFIQKWPETKLENLSWSKISEEEMNRNSAVEYCENLNEDNHSDWTLPTISQLRTLIKNCPATETIGECKVTDNCLSWGKCKKGVCEGCSNKSDGRYSKFGDLGGFWSSSAESSGDNAWNVDFNDGSVNSYYKGYNYAVRCVR